MKIELTNLEVSNIVLRFIVESQKVHKNGEFRLNWRIAMATGLPAELVGATVTVNEPTPKATP